MVQGIFSIRFDGLPWFYFRLALFCFRSVFAFWKEESGGKNGENCGSEPGAAEREILFERSRILCALVYYKYRMYGSNFLYRNSRIIEVRNER